VPAVLLAMTGRWVKRDSPRGFAGGRWGQALLHREPSDVFVLPASEKFAVLASNRLDGICLATPAISRGNIFWRTKEHVVAVGVKR